MKLLLDTHAMLWFVVGDSRLSGLSKSLIEDETNDKLLSIACVWEIAIKNSVGKLDLDEPLEDLLPKAANAIGFKNLDISVPHACRVVELPFHHRDPFDRMLVAQCLCDGLPIVSSDLILDHYGVKRYWN